jgi:hypothetical protein
MSYKPDEKDWMAYIYGELEGDDKERFEQYLLENEDARKELQRYYGFQRLIGVVEDKEVIAPPIVFGDSRQRFLWDAPYFKTIVSIAASLLLIIMVGKLTGTQLVINGNEMKLSFGESQEVQTVKEQNRQASLTEEQVQEMINASLNNNNELLAQSWKENEEKLSGSIRQNLAINSGKVDALLKEAATASQDQISGFVASMQAENRRMVQDYFQLSTSEQKTYIENLLVDFADYLQQQRNNDLQLVQMRMNSLEKNTDVFKQETEQILSSIITTVGNPSSKEIKN